MSKNAKLLILGILILITGVVLFIYSLYSLYIVQSLDNKYDFNQIDNNNTISNSEKYFKHLSISDELYKNIYDNRNLPIKNASCAYMDFAQVNNISLYKLTFNGMQTEESRKTTVERIIRKYYEIAGYYQQCKNTPLYKEELKKLIDDIERQDDIYEQQARKVDDFMTGGGKYIENLGEGAAENIYDDVPDESMIERVENNQGN